MADLLCGERLGLDRLAEADPVFFRDFRVLDNLLDSEPRYIPRCNYFNEVQPDLKPFMRKVVSTWMMEVCEEERCEDQVFSTAVNLLDRFLCECRIDKSQLQMIACVCLLVASKMRQCHALTVGRLVYFTDNSVTPDEIRQFELVVLSRLKWDIATVTGFDYVDHVLERVTWSREQPLIRRHARTLVDLCYTEPALFRKSPALIASGCLVAAARGLKVGAASAASVCGLTRCRVEDVETAVVFIESLVEAQVPTTPRPPPAPTAPAKHAPAPEDDPRHPETPTDVQEIFF
ncbi:G1/S-specific cyclin-D2-like [Homalodisca vitripennis]|nr:G1/S-specific cyclin-D2-like [Homalodisca vitripennis]